MLEQITPAITALVTSQFVVAVGEFTKGASTEAGKTLLVELWGKLKEKFKKNDRATKAMLTIEQQESKEALSKLTTYIDDEIQDSPDFGSELRQLVQRIIDLDESQQQQTFSINTAEGGTSNTVGVLNNSGGGDVFQGDKKIEYHYHGKSH